MAEAGEAAGASELAVQETRPSEATPPPPSPPAQPEAAGALAASGALVVRGAAGGEATALMAQSLDEVLQLPEQVQDLQVVRRDFADGSGHFEAVHNSQLSNSIVSGVFESRSAQGTTRYEGTFQNSAQSSVPTPLGQGIRQNPDGSTYTGQWKDGKQHGHGEWKAPPPSCESYIGEWKNGRKHGWGVYKLQNGDTYDGDFANGKFQDRGKYLYANGDEFLGLWENGVKVSGTFYFRDGRVSTRKWDKGVLVSCQDFDAQRQVYQPTLSKARVHDPERRGLGLAGSAVISPRGIPMIG